MKTSYAEILRMICAKSFTQRQVENVLPKYFESPDRKKIEQVARALDKAFNTGMNVQVLKKILSEQNLKPTITFRQLFNHIVPLGEPCASALRSICAKLNGTYDSSSLQVQVPDDLAKQVIKWGKENILDKDLHDNAKDTKGREDDIHTTLHYGIKSPDVDEVKNLFVGVQPFRVRLGLVTLFRDKPDYDVVKIDVESSEMQKLHYKVENSVDNNNSYPSYAPHTTVAYVKKGTADKLNGDDTFQSKVFTVDEIIFSSLNGNKIPITLEA